MKKKIALVAGGYSGEYVISIETAKTIAAHLDKEQYEVYPIFISKEGWWYQENDRQTSVDKNDFSIELDGQKINFDAAFIAIHGTPGEDGRLQGYFDMIGLPYSTCSAIVSALTFNKGFCNRVVKDYDIVHIANSVVVYKDLPYSVGVVLETVKLPVFVKPNEGGSSLGVSKVTMPQELVPAIEKALKEDNQDIIEEFIKGRELTIGVYALNGQVYTLPPTEIISKNEFFDYEAKYTPGVTNEVTPAVITTEILDTLNRKSIAIYQQLNCRGIVRMDFILEEITDEQIG